MTNEILMTKSEGTRKRDDSFWLDGETLIVRAEPDSKPVYDFGVLEGGALRRQLREQGSRERAPSVPQASRMREV